MKKSKIFLAAGTLILAATAVFATKASKKFAPSFRSAFVGASSTYYVSAPSQLFTTKSNSKFHKMFVSISTVGSSHFSITAGAREMEQNSTQIFVTDVSNL